jgi:hypothetical protein
MKINPKNLVLDYDEDENALPLPFGHDSWTGKDGNDATYVTRIYTLRWKPEQNPHSNDENSPTRDIGYISFHEDGTQISHVYMKAKYRGTGLGKLMYGWVAREEGYLSSDPDFTSPDAQRVWSKLMKVFPSRKVYVEAGTKLNRIYPLEK